MKCDRCDNEATVHEVMIRNGKRVERHLCEACAKGEGMAAGQASIPITQLLNQFITGPLGPAGAGAAGAAEARTPAGTCPACGVTLGQFKQTGLLGCPECYSAFEAQLAPLLQRAHEGGTHHTGRRPRRIREGGAAAAAGEPVAPAAPAPAPAARARAAPAAPAGGGAGPANEARLKELVSRIAELRLLLAKAVQEEKYEQAAALRDQVAVIEKELAAQTERAGGAGAAGPGKGGAQARAPRPRPTRNPRPPAEPEEGA